MNVRTACLSIERKLKNDGSSQGALDAMKMWDIGTIKASEFGCVRMVKLLLFNGANGEVDNGEPLRLASRNGHSEVVETLLENDCWHHSVMSRSAAVWKRHLKVIEVYDKWLEKNPDKKGIWNV